MDPPMDILRQAQITTIKDAIKLLRSLPSTPDIEDMIIRLSNMLLTL